MSPMDHAREGLKPYRTWKPTGFDTPGLGCDDRQDWLVGPCGTNRDADCVTRSNWTVLCSELERIDPEGNDHEVHRFGHWGPGWFEIVLVRPGSACMAYCGEALCALADYPILSDDHHSDLEFRETIEYWDSMSLRDRVRECQRAGVTPFAARPGRGCPDAVYERLRDSL